MNEQEILQKLTDIFRLAFDDDNIVALKTMTAHDVEKWDSLSHIDMMVMVEDTFKVKLSMREISGMKNVGDLVQTLSTRLN